MKKTVLLLVVAVVLAATCAPAGAADTHKMGKKAPSGDLVFIVHGIADPAESGSEYLAAKPGNRLVAIDVEVINPKTESQAFSSILGFSLLTKDRREYNMTLTMLEPSAPDGEIPAKFGTRGWVSFEIPADAVPKYFRAKGNITANGALIKLKAPAPAPTP